MKVGLMNPKFRYYKAAETDVARTFRRVMREQREAAEREAAVKADPKKFAALKARKTA